MTKILYAEDVEFLRNGITADLQREPGFEVSSCNLESGETLRLVRKDMPNVLLLDVMSDTNIHEGITIARELRADPLRRNGKLKVLLLTIFREDDEAIKSALDQGLADGIVTKPATSESIIREIKKIIQN